MNKSGSRKKWAWPRILGNVDYLHCFAGFATSFILSTMFEKLQKWAHFPYFKGTNMTMIMPDIISDFPILCRLSKNTLFEKDSKCRIWIWHFPSICGLLKLTCLVTLIDRKLQFFNSKCKLDCDFFCDFQPPWTHSFIQLL